MARPKNKKKSRGRAKKAPRKATRKTAAPKRKPAIAKDQRVGGAGDVREHAVQPKPAVEMAPCHFCKKDCDKNDMFCFGCKTVICGECDVSMGEYGHGHSPEDHRIEPEHITW